MQDPPRGDERELFRLHNGKLVNVIRRRFRLSEEEARDVVQFAWLKFLEKQPATTNVFGWLYTTAKHEVYARARRGKRERAAEQVPEPSHDADLPARLDRAEVGRLLRTVMRTRLTDNQRVALTLWAQGYRYKEIAERLGKTYTWANRHITEGLAALRRAMLDDSDLGGGEHLGSRA
jgi:RNA polymerase sigma factor (sigma-70 family)